MGAVIDFPVDWNICALCEAQLTPDTAPGREDGLYCDSCLERIVDRVDATSSKD